MSYSYESRLEQNVYAAIDALESERFYHFTHDLLKLVDFAKHNQRLLQSLLSQHAGVPAAQCSERLEKAHAQDTWY